MKRTSHNDKPCGIAQTLGIIGDSWTMLILRNCFMRTRRFDDFQHQLGLTRHVLTDRLKKLVDYGILKKVPYGESGKRYEYLLTHKGKSLAPVFMAMSNWGNEWLFEDSNAPTLYKHQACGQVMQPVMSCSCCGGVVDSSNVKMTMGHAVQETMKQEPEERWDAVLGFSPAQNFEKNNNS